MQQFYIESLDNTQLSKEQINQCKKVLRMRKDDQVRLVDSLGNGGIYSFTDDTLSSLKLVESLVFSEKKVKITIIAALIRTERLEWMIQKCCELGADKIILFSADHGVVRGFKDKTERKIERFNLIAKEASEQSYRQFPTIIEGVIGLDSLSDYESSLNVYADVKKDAHIFKLMKDHDSVSIVIGPEGGFSDSERNLMSSKNFTVVSLGNQVLRAETASMCACALVSSAGECS